MFLGRHFRRLDYPARPELMQTGIRPGKTRNTCRKWKRSSSCRLRRVSKCFGATYRNSTKLSFLITKRKKNCPPVMGLTVENDMLLNSNRKIEFSWEILDQWTFTLFFADRIRFEISPRLYYRNFIKCDTKLVNVTTLVH